MVAQYLLASTQGVSPAPHQPDVMGATDVGHVLNNTSIANAGFVAMGAQEEQGLSQELDHSTDSHSSEDQQLLVHSQNQFYGEGARSQEELAENMQPSRLHTLRRTPPSNYYSHFEQFLSYDDDSRPVASGSSSQGGAIRTQHSAARHLPVYTRPDSTPHTASTSNQRSLWICRWEGCNDAFSSLKDLERHVLRPKPRENTVSKHKLLRGHSKEIRCRWGNCSKSFQGIWRHILSDSHLCVMYHCPSCGKWNTRQHSTCS